MNPSAARLECRLIARRILPTDYPALLLWGKCHHSFSFFLPINTSAHRNTTPVTSRTLLYGAPRYGLKGSPHRCHSQSSSTHSPAHRHSHGFLLQQRVSVHKRNDCPINLLPTHDVHTTSSLPHQISRSFIRGRPAPASQPVGRLSCDFTIPSTSPAKIVQKARGTLPFAAVLPRSR
jgi:hypothetical protein